MKTLVLSSKDYDQAYFEQARQQSPIQLDYLPARLDLNTLAVCTGYEAICVFVNDQLSAPVIEGLCKLGVRHIALRCAGFNNVDINAAKQLGIRVSRVPAYSPEAVAEHTLALMLSLNRKIHKAYNRVRENNFSLDGLLGFNFYGKTIGVVGTGRIGRCVINILLGMGCHVLCYDPYPDASLEQISKVSYTDLASLMSHSDIITLHCPLTQESHHMINQNSISQMRDNVMLINTSRGALVDTQAVIQGLKSKKIGYLGLDVYEMESELFFEDLSLDIVQDDVFDRLTGFPNVIITGHQGFFTHEALEQIAQITLNNLSLAAQNQVDDNTFLC